MRKLLGVALFGGALVSSAGVAMATPMLPAPGTVTVIVGGQPVLTGASLTAGNCAGETTASAESSGRSADITVCPPGGPGGTSFSLNGGLLTGTFSGGGTIDPTATFSFSITNLTGLPQTIIAVPVIPLVPALSAPVDIHFASLGVTITSAATPGAVGNDPFGFDPSSKAFFGVNSTIDGCADQGGITTVTGTAHMSTTKNFNQVGDCIVSTGGPFTDYFLGLDIVISGALDASYGFTWGVTVDAIPEPEMTGLVGVGVLMLAGLRARRLRKHA
jgi:hypothetical protein